MGARFSCSVLGGTFVYDYIDIRVVHLSSYQYWAHATNIVAFETRIMFGNSSRVISDVKNVVFVSDSIKAGVVH